MAWAFDEYVLDLDQRELLRSSAPVKVEPQALDLLAYLVAHRGRVVSKDELVEEVWQGRIVSDAALTTRINAVRRAVGDDGKTQRFIRTYSRKGVRFVGMVRESPTACSSSEPPWSLVDASVHSDGAQTVLPLDHDAAASDLHPDAGARPLATVFEPAFGGSGNSPADPGIATGLSTRLASVLSRRRWVVLGAAVAIVFLIAALIIGIDRLGYNAAPRGIVVVALVPFAPISSHDEASAGTLTNTLITYLANTRFRVSPVLAPQAAKPVDVAMLRSKFGARFAITGTVQRADNGLGVTVNLVDTASRAVLWADTFEQPIETARRPEIEAAKRLAREVSFESHAALAKEAKGNPDDWSVAELIGKAWTIRLEGEWTSQAYDEALDLFERALRKDPRSVSAMIGISNILVSRDFQWQTPSTAELTRARELLAHAREINPESASVAYEWGVYHWKVEHRIAVALEDFKQSVELDPSNVPGYARAGVMLVALGRADEGLAQLRYAMQLGPKDPTIAPMYQEEAIAEIELGDYPAALDAERRAFVLNLHYPRMYAVMASIYAWLGDKPAALEQISRLREITQQTEGHPSIALILGGCQPKKGSLNRFKEGFCRALAWSEEAETSDRNAPAESAEKSLASH